MTDASFSGKSGNSDTRRSGPPVVRQRGQRMRWLRCVCPLRICTKSARLVDVLSPTIIFSHSSSDSAAAFAGAFFPSSADSSSSEAAAFFAAAGAAFAAGASSSSLDAAAAFFAAAGAGDFLPFGASLSESEAGAAFFAAAGAGDFLPFGAAESEGGKRGKMGRNVAGQMGEVLLHGAQTPVRQHEWHDTPGKLRARTLAHSVHNCVAAPAHAARPVHTRTVTVRVVRRRRLLGRGRRRGRLGLRLGCCERGYGGRRVGTWLRTVCA